MRNKINGWLEPLESRVLLSVAPFDGPSAALVQASVIDDPVTSTITALSPLANAITNSTAKEESKVWQHGNQWWSVLDTVSNTTVYRLDGSAWTPVITLDTKAYQADVKPIGNGDITYVLLYSGTASKLAELSFSNNTYQLVPLISQSTPFASVPLSDGSDSATIDVDTTGRMWVASDTFSTIEVRHADAPYTSWSAPTTLATGMVSERELSGIVAFSGNIGVLWSNHNTKRFGFRYHVDGTDPTVFAADEVPASQSALNVGSGMADGHVNIHAASDGTVYAAVKTAYDAGTQAAPEMALLVRRPNGQWDPLYGIDGHGTRPILAVDEVQGFLRYMYAGETGVNDIVYKDIRLSAIDPNQPSKFYSGADVSNPIYPRQTLIPGGLSKNVASVKEPVDGELVIVATNASSGAYSTSGGTGPYTITGAKMVDTPVSGANQPPVNSVPGTQTMLEDATLVFSSGNGNAISVSDPDAGIGNLRVTLTVTGGTVTMGTTNLTVTGNGTSSVVATGTIANLNAALNGTVFTPTANLNGTSAAAIQVLTDDLGNTGTGGNRTDTDTIAINITPVNDAPSFTAGGNQTVLEDAGPQTVTSWAMAMSPGPPDEATQALNFIVSNNNNALFSVQPTIAADGTLTYAPALNANGMATVSVALHDNGGTANGGVDTSATQTFTITVTAVNDAPSFTAGGNQTVLEDAGPQTVTSWATAMSAGPPDEASQALN
ncbi:MAG: hypothetical protein HY288_15610, partial [Planctomycetia bacterium]|nr:hypothetical protein [Planctomycetia bacterium]